MRTYVLDDQLHLVPIGLQGQLCLGGVGLAHGYFRRPDLTAERFVPDPFSSEIGARMYKTGDLARYLEHGAIEFVGRVDHQVKLRGFRIELGEIEAVLRRHPGAREAIVIIREDMPGNQHLVAYLVVDATAPPDVSELRSFLKESLPPYMIPSAFVLLDTLPLMPNGKLDRQALPVPNRSHSVADVPYVAPRSSIEQLLATVWSSVLGGQEVGINDNFFSLGGHSLLAIQVIARISAALQMEIPLRTLFEAPTIVELGNAIESRMIEQIESLSEDEIRLLMQEPPS